MTDIATPATDEQPLRVDPSELKGLLNRLAEENHIKVVLSSHSKVISGVRVDESGMELLASLGIQVKRIQPSVDDKYGYDVKFYPAYGPDAHNSLKGALKCDLVRALEPAWQATVKLEEAREKADIARELLSADEVSEKTTARFQEMLTPSSRSPVAESTTQR